MSPTFLSLHLQPPSWCLISPIVLKHPRIIMSEFPNCGWVDLPKCRKRCWFAQLPRAEELPNYISIMDDFGVNLEQTGQDFEHIMMW